MKLNYLIQFSLALCLVGLASTQVLAYTPYGQDWRDNYPDACQELQDATLRANNCIICHSAGFGLNPYGSDFKEANEVFADIEDMDSDGDGRTNGEEILNDCSLPGDAVSPADTDTWGGIKALFR